MAQTDKERRERIRILNDRLRQKGIGGQIMITNGVQSLDPELQKKIMLAVSRFSDFTKNNDPYGEHDCAAIDIEGQRIFWKIDYYDLELKAGSPDPSDPNVTSRILTIMLSSEY